MHTVARPDRVDQAGQEIVEQRRLDPARVGRGRGGDGRQGRFAIAQVSWPIIRIACPKVMLGR